MPVSQSFKNRADRAAFFEAWVGCVLARAGLYTLHYPFTYDDGKDHGLSWDLEVGADHPLSNSYDPHDARSRKPVLKPVEVKAISPVFMSPTDYPYSDLIVCSQNNWVRKWSWVKETQRDFLYVCNSNGAIVWLPIGSPVTLGNEVTDSTRGETYNTVKTSKVNLKPLADFVEYMKHG